MGESDSSAVVGNNEWDLVLTDGLSLNLKQLELLVAQQVKQHSTMKKTKGDPGSEPLKLKDVSGHSFYDFT